MGKQHAPRRQSIRAGAWGLLAGLVGSLCCIGPSAAILLGLGSSSLLFGLQLDQRLALGGGMLLLAGGGLLAAYHARTCYLRPQLLWRRVTLMLASGIGAYLLLGVLTPWAAARQEQALTETTRTARSAEQVPVAAAARLRQATLTVEKMDCPPCVTHLNSLLARKPFVQRFEAHAGNEQLLIVYDSSQIDSARLLATIPQQYRAVLNSDVLLP